MISTEPPASPAPYSGSPWPGLLKQGIRSIACDEVTGGAWCYAGTQDCTDNSKTYCRSPEDGGFRPVVCPNGTQVLCKGADDGACLASCVGTDYDAAFAPELWQTTASKSSFWAVPAAPVPTAAAIISDVCGASMLNGTKQAQQSCRCIAANGTSACPDPVGNSAIFGALAAARIFDARL